MFIHLSVWVCACRAQMPEEGSGSHEAGVARGCESPDVGTTVRSSERAPSALNC